ncbi:MAG: tyrosine-type recombinase/integrase [Eubacteriales bacterium]
MNLKYTLFKRSNSKIWYFYYYHDGKRISKSTGKTRKYEAQEYCEKFLEEPQEKAVYLKDFAKDFYVWGKCKWIKAQHEWDHSFSEETARWRRNHLTKYILPAFGKRYLRTITKNEVRNWLITLKIANQTKNHILFSFRIILREAEDEGLVKHNPIEKLQPFGLKSKKERDIFSLNDLKLLFPPLIEDLERIWGNVKNAALFLIMSSTGVRSGEVRALQWKHILKDGWIHIEQAAKPGGKVGETKTKSERLVYIPKRVQQVLQVWKEESVFTDPEDFIFFGAYRNRAINVTTVSKLVPKALQRAEIKTDGKNLVAHSFRHTFNTMMRKEIPEDLLRQLTGHKSESMTDLYDHPTLEDKIAILNRVRPKVEKLWE